MAKHAALNKLEVWNLVCAYIHLIGSCSYCDDTDIGGSCLHNFQIFISSAEDVYLKEVCARSAVVCFQCLCLW